MPWPPAVALALRRGTKCFYTTPIKALSNQKYHDLVAQHGEDAVGLLTGDTSINGSADIVVMTTEVLRNIIRFYGDSMQSTVSSYLELSLEFFSEQQQQFKHRVARLLDVNNPLAALRELSQYQVPIWRTVRREFLANLKRKEKDGEQPQVTGADADNSDQEKQSDR